MSHDILMTDLYQLTMLQGYHHQGMNETAVFEFFVRQLPDQRGFLLAAGLEQLVDYLEQVRFENDDLDWLRGTGRFDDAFIDSLQGFLFPIDA